ncbi:recombinase family protein [Alteriqipengyuania sp. 357]
MVTFSADRIWVPRLSGKCVAYLRTSNRPHSRLRADAQLAAVNASLRPGRTKLIEKFTEFEPLDAGIRPELMRAAQFCCDNDAVLLIGQIERMRSAVRWLGYLHEHRVKFRGADAPHINHLSYNQFVAADLHQRKEIGQRVREALADAQKSGTVLGRKNGCPGELLLGPEASAKARQRNALQRDSRIMEQIRLIQYRGVTSLTGIATRLNQMKIPAPRGGQWSATQVQRVMNRLSEEQS